jgi:hypothetical protein
LARMERWFVRKSGAGDAGGCVFSVEISRNVWLDSMIPRDLMECYDKYLL